MLLRNIALSLALFTGSAFAIGEKPIPVGPDLARHYSFFTEINLDPATGIKNIVDGNVSLGLDTLTITLFQRDAKGNLEVEREIQLPVIKLETSCGSRVVIARDDKRPVDGALHEVVLLDHRTRVCKDLVANMTEVTLKTSIVSRRDGKELTTESDFSGPALQPALE